jgi:predicted TIM-barrel fold metal-dependent hydrolase
VKRVDAFAHIVPERYRDHVHSHTSSVSSPIKDLWRDVSALTDVSTRIRVMDELSVDQQVVTLATPPVEEFGDSKTATALSAFANEAMADVVHNSNNRLLGTCTVSLTDPEAACAELRRGVEQLGLIGVQLFSNVQGEALDSPRFDEFYSEIERLNVPIWLHPFRSENVPDFRQEETSKYLIWYALGWPIDTTLAMARIVLGGVFVRHPALKIIIHHAGALVPSLAHRIKTIYREEWMANDAFAPGVGRPIVDEFKRFYVDTVVTYGGYPALKRAIDFFGMERVVFGTDFPYGLKDGREFTQLAIDAVACVDSVQDQANVYHQTLESILGAHR